MPMNRETPFPIKARETISDPEPHQPPIAPDASTRSAAPAKPKQCPECGGEVGPRSHGVMKIFCQPKCKARYHSRSKQRGQALLPMLLAWRTGRGGTDIAKKAYAQVCQILDDYAAEDRKAGRPPVAQYAEKLLWMGVHRDRRRS